MACNLVNFWRGANMSRNLNGAKIRRTKIQLSNLITANKCKKIKKVRGAALMLLRKTDFSCPAAWRGAPTAVRGGVRCAVAISNAKVKLGIEFGLLVRFRVGLG